MEILVTICTTLGLGSILTMCVQKFFSRKSDKVDLSEKQMQMADKIINTLQNRLDIYINQTEKAIKDIANLQAMLGRIYHYTCILDCPERQLMDSGEVNACVTINNSDSAD